MAEEPRLVVTGSVLPGIYLEALARAIRRVARVALALEPEQVDCRITVRGGGKKWAEPSLEAKFDWHNSVVDPGDYWALYFEEQAVLAGDLDPEQSLFYSFKFGRSWVGSIEKGVLVTSINGVRYAVIVDKAACQKQADGDTEALPYQLCRDAGDPSEWPDVGEPQATLEACHALAFEDAGPIDPFK